MPTPKSKTPGPDGGAKVAVDWDAVTDLAGRAEDAPPDEHAALLAEVDDMDDDTAAVAVEVLAAVGVVAEGGGEEK